MTSQQMSKRQETTPAKREDTRSQVRVLTPAVDIFESVESLTVVADLPGVDTNGLDISMDKGVLTLNGNVKTEGRGQPLLREFSSANYYRQFKVSDQFDVDNSYAELRDGVLILRIPKTEAAKPKRIEVRS